MGRFRYPFLLLSLAVLLTLSACREDPLSADITLDADYSGVTAALDEMASSLASQLAAIEQAVDEGLADNQEALRQIQAMVASLNGTMEEKLSAIASVVKLQTTGLEAKLGLIEAAVQEGFAADTTQQALLRAAIDAVGGKLETKLAAVEAAVQGQTLNLEMKLGLIEATVRTLAATDDEACALIREAIVSLEGTLEEKLSAIAAAVEAQSAGLATKIELIAAALGAGFLDETEAVRTAQTALDSSLQVVDGDLLSVRDSVVAGLDSLVQELTPEALAQAFHGIRDAVNAQTQSTTAMLQALLRAVNEAIEALNRFELTWLGDPTETIMLRRGETFEARLRVKPVGVPFTKDSMRLEVVSDKRYFLPEIGPGDGADNFFIRSLEAVTGEEGVYVATLQADSPVVLWEEAQLSIVARKSGREVATDPIPVTILPRPTEGLRIWHYPRASFKMREINGIKYDKDSLGVIYAALDSRDFVSKDNPSDVRTYTPSFLDSVQFVEEEFELHKHRHVLVPDDDSVANVFINFVKGQDYIGFYPDTLENRVWQNYQCSIGHLNVDLKGKLVVTDQWKKKDSIDDFHLGWWNTTWYSDKNLQCSVNDIEDNPQGQLKDTIKIESLFDFCGVKNTSLDVVPYDRFSVDRSRFIYPQSHSMTGKFVDKNWKAPNQYENDEWNILLNVGSASAGSYSMQGIVTVSIFPRKSQSAFRVQQLYVNYELMLTITDPNSAQH